VQPNTPRPSMDQDLKRVSIHDLHDAPLQLRLGTGNQRDGEDDRQDAGESIPHDSFSLSLPENSP